VAHADVVVDATPEGVDGASTSIDRTDEALGIRRDFLR